MLVDRRHHPVFIEANEKTPSPQQTAKGSLPVFSHIVTFSGQHTGHNIGKVGVSHVRVL